MKRPTGVTRGSSFCAHTAPVSTSASTRMERNLNTVNSDAIETHPRLPVQHRTRRRQPHRQRRQQHDGRRHHDSHHRHGRYSKSAGTSDYVRAARVRPRRSTATGGFPSGTRVRKPARTYWRLLRSRVRRSAVPAVRPPACGCAARTFPPRCGAAAWCAPPRAAIPADPAPCRRAASCRLHGGRPRSPATSSPVSGCSCHVCADVLQQRTAADHQQAVAPHHREGERAEQQPPQENTGHRNRAAHQHHADRHPQVGVDVGNQPLRQECHAHHQAQLLDQHDPRFDVRLRVQIVKMQARSEC